MNPNKYLVGALTLNLLAVSSLAVLTTDFSSTSNQTLENESMHKFSVEGLGDYAKYHENVRVLGSEVLDLIDKSNDIGLSIFVVNKETPNLANTYGLSLGGYTEPNYSVPLLLSEGSMIELNFPNEPDITYKELKSLIANVHVKQTGKDLDTLGQPALNFSEGFNDGSDNLRYFVADYAHGISIEDTKPTDNIEADSRYYSLLIMNKENQLMGIYLEEAGLPYSNAFVGNVFKSTWTLDELPNVGGVNENEQ